ncbi:MAG: helix-hairpin-helix domain-containing protein [Ruminiclostridium sp.]|nr:helix-hairpin-helix domain-containing protein [Ruminiclostridium sp.]
MKQMRKTHRKETRSLPDENKNKPDDTKRGTRLPVVMFCIAAAVYLAVCAVIFMLSDKNERDAYVTSKPISYADESISEPQKKININTASHDELTEIAGIGDTTADRIIEYREKNGSFISPEDIINVNGIGMKLYSKIKQYIEV